MKQLEVINLCSFKDVIQIGLLVRQISVFDEQELHQLQRSLQASQLNLHQCLDHLHVLSEQAVSKAAGQGL